MDNVRTRHVLCAKRPLRDRLAEACLIGKADKQIRSGMTKWDKGMQTVLLTFHCSLASTASTESCYQCCSRGQRRDFEGGKGGDACYASG